MNKPIAKTTLHLVALLILMFLVSGCGTETSTATSLLPTYTLAPPSPTMTGGAPTGTPLPPTDTSVPPSPTATVEAPTSTPTPSPTPLPPLSESGGGVIAFVSDRGGNPGIMMMNADGSDQRQLTNDFDSHPDWSHDGKQLAFSTTRSDIVAIFTIDIENNNLQQLTNTDRSPSAPDWSPDGKRFAFIYNPAHPGIDYELFLMNANGKGFKALTDSAGYQTYASPDWSPDGERIVFSADLEGNQDIYLMDSDGSNVQQLTDAEVHDRAPAWSPDGSRIAFETYRDGNWEIYVMNVDGSNMRNLSNNPGRDLWPSWSPDGSRIAFQTDRDGNWEIYVMNSDGTEQLRLTVNDDVDIEPAWKP